MGRRLQVQTNDGRWWTGVASAAEDRGAADRVCDGLLFYLRRAGESHELTCAYVHDAALRELLAELPVRTLRGEAAAGELLAAAQVVAEASLLGAAEQGLAEEPGACVLTRREAEVLQLVVLGCTNKGVAVHLGITERGVRHHLENIYQKLGVSGRAQAIAWALRQGLA